MTDYKSLLVQVLNTLSELEVYFPEETISNFIRLLVPFFRRTMHNARAINILINYDLSETHSDSALALLRKSLEDFITIKYMISFDKDSLTEKFLNHTEGEFTESEELVTQYLTSGLLSAAAIKEITNAQSRSWCGKNFETQLNELSKSKKLEERDEALFYIAYHLSCRTLHTSGSDIKRFLSPDTLTISDDFYQKTALTFMNIVLLELASILLQEYNDNNLWDTQKSGTLSTKIVEFKKILHNQK